jgi:hypothetical protein
MVGRVSPWHILEKLGAFIAYASIPYMPRRVCVCVYIGVKKRRDAWVNSHTGPTIRHLVTNLRSSMATR